MADQDPDYNPFVLDEDEIDDEDEIGPRNQPQPVQLFLLPKTMKDSERFSNIDDGGKLILPPSALYKIYSNNPSFSPLMFQVTNLNNGKSTHCGVLEFTAEPDVCYVPSWIMTHLQAEDLVSHLKLTQVTLPAATFCKFQPQSQSFLEITDPKPVLERSLRKFTCLTPGDIIPIHYNSQIFSLLVEETLPDNGVAIIECDMNVDFSPPLGYVEPRGSSETKTEEAEDTSIPIQTNEFPGTGFTLNGSRVESNSQPNSPVNVKKNCRPVPDTEWKIGTLNMKRQRMSK